MNIYVISQSQNTNYETYDACVVIAESETEAAKWHPATDSTDWSAPHYMRSWCDSPEDVTVELVGHTDDGVGFILKSYNAG